MIWIPCVCLILCLFAGPCRSIEQDDLVQLPGVIFQTNFSTYSGVLHANDANTSKMQYILFESRSSPSNDPLLIWLSGGPGCSGVAEVFQEHGPFYVTADSTQVFENIYGWNRYLNFMTVDSPIGTGFSYDASNVTNVKASDESTADQHYRGLRDFFNRVQTRYQKRDFYIAGVSYAGVYLPMLAAKLAEDDQFPANFKGMAVGNGVLHINILNNALVLWSNYHSRISFEDWETLKSCCQQPLDIDSCDWTGYLTTKNNFDFHGDNTICGKLLEPIMQAPNHVDPINYYEGCYSSDNSKNNDFYSPKTSSNQENPATQFNRDSTDALNGYNCWAGYGVTNYLNRKDVQKALHVGDEFIAQNVTFQNCNGALYDQYILTNPDMTPFFTRIFAKKQQFHILIYNGDVDTVCNYLGDARFAQKLAKSSNFDKTARQSWYFRDAIAGFHDRYYNAQKDIVMDVLTVNGAGHLVPVDRPGPAYQMINNFVRNLPSNYSSTYNIQVLPPLSPLLNAATTTSSSTTPSSTTTTTSGCQSIVFNLAVLLVSAVGIWVNLS